MGSRIRTAVTAYTKNPAVKPTPTSTAKQGKAVATFATPVGFKAPAPAPAAPTQPAAPLPWDANYETTIGGINRNREQGLTGLTTEETGVKQAYGFDDLTNPFSKLALLKESFANAQRGTTNSMAAAGQLYSGAIANRRSADQHGQDINYDALRRQYDSDLSGIAARRTGIGNAAADATTSAGWDRTQAALVNRPDPASIPGPAAPAAPVAPAAKPYTERPGRDSKGNPGVWHDYKDGRKPVFVKKG